jgi:hypothetical protein
MARATGIGRGWRPIVKLETRRSPWAISGLPVGFGASFSGGAMVGDDRDIRNRVAHVVAQLRQISEGSGRINARDTWLTVTLAIAELESLLTILRKRLP